ncbi:MAG: M48 family metallopeptidase, partial [Elusimicrobia bacterium]|nr:M48 family metallopeptidase [Elusimicrobiota bacterium]
GDQAYAEVLKQNPLSDNAAYQAQVARVGARISQAADQPDFKWEFKVLHSKEVNAFCLPGGKVAFYDAIMPLCGDDAGVAVVMGHEVGHAVASHSAERMSQGLGANVVAEVLGAGLGAKDPSIRQNVMQLYGLGAQYGVILPFSRKQESEADKIGLILMAKAGYDPRVAVGFWEKMSAQSQGAPPEFLSTHPSDSTRIAQIKSWMPEALTYYKG